MPSDKGSKYGSLFSNVMIILITGAFVDISKLVTHGIASTKQSLCIKWY